MTYPDDRKRGSCQDTTDGYATVGEERQRAMHLVRQDSIAESLYFEAIDDLNVVSNEEETPPRKETSAGNEASSDRFDKNDGKLWSVTCIRETCGAIVNNDHVQIGIVVLIIVNAIMMGIGTFDFVTDNKEREDKFEKVDRAFLIVFTVELGMQFIYRGFNLFTDGWLIFDFVIIILSWSFASLQIIRAFRIFRALRLVTRIPALRDLVMSLFNVLPRMCAITALLLLIFYIFAVLFTTLFKDVELSDDFFSRLDASLFTCFQMMTMEWSPVTREIMEVYTWAWAPSVAFVMISGFIVFNLIIAVVCDAVAMVENEARELEMEAAELREAETADSRGSVRLGEGGNKIPPESQERIDSLSVQVSSLIKNQKEMQESLELLARELYLLHRPPAPSETPIVNGRPGGFFGS